MLAVYLPIQLIKADPGSPGSCQQMLYFINPES